MHETIELVAISSCETSSSLILRKYIHSLIHSFILFCVLQQVHNLYQSEFSTESVLVPPRSIYSIPLFPGGHLAAAYVFFFFVPSLLLFPPSFLQ